jgi:hypothetical protein
LPYLKEKLTDKIMKAMKTGTLVTLILLATGVIYAQEYKLTVQNPKDGRVIFKDFSGSLPIEGYSGNEIIITSNAEAITPPEKAKGLKAIYPAGSDNTGIGLDVQKIDNLITITCLVPFTRDPEYRIKVPESIAVELESGCERNNDVTIKNTKNEIEIKTCHDIKAENVTGPLILSTISGNIDITYGQINTVKASSVNSISGDIDITLPSKTPTDLHLSTISGAVYSDFDFTDTKKNMKKIGGNDMNYSLNGGGFEFNISSINGTIFLRKGN